MVRKEDEKFFPNGSGTRKELVFIQGLGEKNWNPELVSYGAGVSKQEINTKFCPSATEVNVKPPVETF